MSDHVQQLQARLTNSENAVRQRLMLQESALCDIAANLDSFRQTYNARLIQEKRNARKKMIGGILASVAGLDFAPILHVAFNSFVDLGSPADVFTAAYSEGSHDKIAQFLANGTSKCVLKPAVAHQFEKLAIPEDEFATALREGICDGEVGTRWQFPN